MVFFFSFFFLVFGFSARLVSRPSLPDLIFLLQVFVDVDVILGLLLVLVVIFVVLVSSSCSPSRSSGVFFSFSFFWVLLLAVIYDDNRMGGAFDFFFILNMFIADSDAHRERWAPLLTQRDLSLRRFRDGGHPGNLPNPGVFARHNAVDTPALLPDGGTSDISVPAPVRARGDERPLDRVDIDEVRAISEGETAIVEGDDK